MSLEQTKIADSVLSAKPARADRFLLDLLICPVTGIPLRYDEQAQELISDQAGLAYPVRDGVPIMIPEQARRIDPYGK